jgi:hypothetical protein
MKRKKSERGEFFGKVRVMDEEEFKKRNTKEKAEMTRVA